LIIPGFTIVVDIPSVLAKWEIFRTKNTALEFSSRYFGVTHMEVSF